MNSRENRIWAWGVGGFVLVLLAIAAGGQADDEDAATTWVSRSGVSRRLSRLTLAGNAGSDG